MNSLIFCGDIHGEMKDLVYKLEKYKIENANVIILGDIGVGFGKPQGLEVLYKSIEKKLEKYNITLYGIRGNHDDPSYFDGLTWYPRLKLLKDHTIIELNGYNIYPIGGAVSVDIDLKTPTMKRSRREENDYLIHKGSHRRCWWPDEVVKKLEVSGINADIVISHTAPLSFSPPLKRFGDYIREETWEEMYGERKYLDDVLQKIRPKYWYYGHFHNSYTGTVENTLYKGLSIMELYDKLY
jgi:predicted phosphodiesterase